MNHDICLACGGQSVRRYSWQSLFGKQGEVLCTSCQSKLHPLTQPGCRRCSRTLADLPETFIQDDYCYDCVRWEKQGSALEKNHSLYTYNEYMKELLALFKYRGDYAIVDCFAEKLRVVLSGIEADYVVPIPLSQERLYERRFNQSEALIRAVGLLPTHLLTRTHSEKQSKKTRKHRINQETIFQFDTHFSIKNKEIVLVDDIYTTGSTLHQAAGILQREGAKSIKSVTIAR